jgi:hypothetical protein
MLACLEPTLVPWTPAFSKVAQEPVQWTQLLCDGVELSNSLESAEWAENPVQVLVCGACGTARCASGGYVHVSRLGDHLLWTRPFRPDSDVSWQTEHAPSYSIVRRGAVLIPSAVWSEWARRFSNLSPFQRFPPTRLIDLFQAWILETRGASSVESLDALEPMLRERLLACDSIDVQEALRLVGAFVTRVKQDPLATVDGHVRRASDTAARIETFYFEGPSDDDWPALAFMPSISLAFGRDWVFEPTSAFMG